MLFGLELRVWVLFVVVQEMIWTASNSLRVAAAYVLIDLCFKSRF